MLVVQPCCSAAGDRGPVAWSNRSCLPTLLSLNASLLALGCRVGRVIGKNGNTIKALQQYSGALIQIDQTVDPTKVTISGTPQSLSLAISMVSDSICKRHALFFWSPGMRGSRHLPRRPVNCVSCVRI